MSTKTKLDPAALEAASALTNTAAGLRHSDESETEGIARALQSYAAAAVERVRAEIKRLRGLLCMDCADDKNPFPADPPRRVWPYHPHVDGSYTRCGAGIAPPSAPAPAEPPEPPAEARERTRDLREAAVAGENIGDLPSMVLGASAPAPPTSAPSRTVTETRECPMCHGLGHPLGALVDRRCETCHGTGRVPRERP